MYSYLQENNTVQNLILLILIAISMLANSAMAFAEKPPFNTRSQGVKNVAVFGDSPYGTSPTDTSQLAATPAFINPSTPIRTFPWRSTWATSTRENSTAPRPTTARSMICGRHSSSSGFVYTPGDNEWADCHKIQRGRRHVQCGHGPDRLQASMQAEV